MLKSIIAALIVAVAVALPTAPAAAKKPSPPAADRPCVSESVAASAPLGSTINEVVAHVALSWVTVVQKNTSALFQYGVCEGGFVTYVFTWRGGDYVNDARLTRIRFSR